MTWRQMLFCQPARQLGHFGRWSRLLLRCLHLMATTLLVVALFEHARPYGVAGPAILTTVSGLLLLGVELYRSCVFLYQLAGVLVLAKLLVLLLIPLLPQQQFEIALVSILIAAFGSHMSGKLRHFSLLHWRVLDLPKKESNHPAP